MPHIILAGALLLSPHIGVKTVMGASMKIVVFKSPKYLSKLLSRIFGVKDPKKDK